MALNKADEYFLKALDNYHYDLEFFADNIGYALSADPDHVPTNFLMGQMYWDRLRDFDRAKAYYDYVLGQDPFHQQTILSYTLMLISNKEYTQAQKLIDHGLTIKGIDPSLMRYRQGLLLESQQDFKGAIAAYKTARKEALSNAFIAGFDRAIERVERKLNKKKRKKKKGKKDKKKRKNKKK